ncbi:MAG: thiol-disulfide oxidoreductase DCC family protein [Methylococcaceae bacterium]|nr:DCC1-like thiol-disulfide oxidoreductase family protein [Prolixibacteraceae bacterium]
MKAPDPKTKIVIQFDGNCILCSRTIQYILKADRHKKFLFQTIQSVPADNAAEESVIVNEGKRIYTHFDAVLKICNELGGMYHLIEMTRILPRKWRYRLYRWVAMNRYRWFGKRESCFLPSAEERKRFI